MTLRESKNHYLRMRYLLVCYYQSGECNKIDADRILEEISRIDTALNILFSIEDTGVQPNPIIQFNLKGECIAIWPSLIDAVVYYGTSRQKISDCIHHRKTDHIGFVWRKLGDSLGNDHSIFSEHWQGLPVILKPEYIRERFVEMETPQERKAYLAESKGGYKTKTINNE